MKNSGLGCGCSSGGMSAVPMAPILSPPARVAAKYTANPGMTVNPAAARQPVATSTALVKMNLVREGAAFGYAWAAGLEQGRTVPAQWNALIEHKFPMREAANFGNRYTGSNRDAFVLGFREGFKWKTHHLVESDYSIVSPTGRVYLWDFLLAQGTVVANTLFSQVRPIVLPASSASIRDQYIALRSEAARTGALTTISLVNGRVEGESNDYEVMGAGGSPWAYGSGYVSRPLAIGTPSWLAYLGGTTNSIPSGPDAVVIRDITYAAGETRRTKASNPFDARAMNRITARQAFYLEDLVDLGYRSSAFQRRTT